MRTTTFVVGAAIVLGLVGPAAASIPPPVWRAPTWTGPAKICAEGFAFDLKADETAEQHYPSVGRIRYTITTPKGGVELAEHWAAGPPELTPEFEDRPGGRLHPVKPEDGGKAGYFFQPTGANGLPVQIRFHGQGWAGKDLDGVLKRIDFGRAARDGCSEPMPGQQAG